MIRIDNSSRYYNDSCAVNGMNFEIKKGEIPGLQVPNGTMKTSCCKI